MCGSMLNKRLRIDDVGTFCIPMCVCVCVSWCVFGNVRLLSVKCQPETGETGSGWVEVISSVKPQIIRLTSKKHTHTTQMRVGLVNKNNSTKHTQKRVISLTVLDRNPGGLGLFVPAGRFSALVRCMRTCVCVCEFFFWLGLVTRAEWKDRKRSNARWANGYFGF